MGADVKDTNGFLAAVRAQALAHPERECWRNTSGRAITYGELWDASDELACVIRERCDGEVAPGAVASDVTGDAVAEPTAAGAPLLVYGHKSPLMPVAFLACLKSGHAYVPCDVHVPAGRVSSILSQLPVAPALAVADLPELPELGRTPETIGGAELASLLAAVRAGAVPRRPDPSWEVSGDDTQYIIFTSGSTGAPKGVCVTAADVANFMPWDQSLFSDAAQPHVFLNQALLSFDLSVTELVGALTTGGRVVALTSDVAEDMHELFSALSASGATCWVSTPTFASVCLADPSFNRELMPALTHFFFCGEPLRPDVVRHLEQRFPDATLINAYGPTESTVAVTAMPVSAPEDASELPVGVARPGTVLLVLDRTTGQPVAPGETGEVLICGDTVAKGYLNRPDKTAAAFGEREVDGRAMRTYRTGDLGRVDERGVLWVDGRIDDQVKVHGFRIELGEVECAIQDEPDVKLVAVIVRTRRGVPDRLEAHVELSSEPPADLYAWSKAMRERLSHRLPSYMVPRRIVVEDEMPKTPNGKVDRRAVRRAVGEL